LTPKILMFNLKITKMKTKIFLLVCLFACIATTQIYAQNGNSKGTRSYVTSDWPIPYGYWAADIYCDGVLIDVIVGSGTAHFVDHVKLGEWVFGIASIKGEGNSLRTGELFTFSEQDKYYSPASEYWTCHTNLKGNKGTYYNVSLIIHPDGTYDVKNATCTGNSK
jgi:hypothetical protein